MRKILLMVATVAVVGASAATATRPAPTVTIAARQPVAIRGVHFLPRERVRVTASAGETRTKTVRASATGTFLVSFEGMVVDRCTTGLRVRAVGGRGSEAVLKLPLPACLPAKNP